MDLDESRRAKLWSKDGEAARIRSHEASMLELRERKEAERKNEVDLERRRRRAELALAHQPKDPESSFLKNNLPAFVSASDTPTIRNSQSAFIRSHLSAHDWAGPESGNDTPTPTAKSSGWSIKNKKEVASSSSSGLLGAFGEAPPLKRFATAPAVAKSSLWEDAAAKKPEASSKPSSVAAAAPIPAPSVASSNKKSKKEKANASAGVGKSLSFSMEEENSDAPNANVLAASSSSLSASIGMGMPGQWGWGEEQFDYHPTMSSSLGFGDASTSGSASISSMNATTQPTQPAPKLQLPDNRRVWLPPAALEANLNQNHNKTSAAQVQKSVSALGTSSHSQTLDIPFPVQKSVSGPPEFEGGGFGRPAASKLPSAPPVVASASKAGSSSLPTPVPVPVPSSTTPASKKKSSSASLTSNSSKGKKPQPQSQPPPQKPKVTIEEVSDSDSDSESESESESVLELARKAKGKGIEKLPPDSRYIIEDAPPPVPKATAAVETKGKGKGKSAANPTTTATTTTTTTKSEPMLAPASKAAQTPKSSGPSSVPKSNTNTKQKSKSNTTAPVIEPKPVVPQEMFREIFEFGDESANGEALTSSILSSSSSQPQQYDVWKPPSSSSSSYTSLPSTSTSSYPSSHPSSTTTMTNDRDRWIPAGAGKNGNGVGETADKHKRVHWTSHSNAYAYDEPQSDAFGNSGTQDVFLSALDSLEAIVRGESGAIGGNGTGETSRLGPGSLSTNGAGGLGTNAGTAAGKRSRLTNNELNANANTNTNPNKKRGGAPNTDDNFWQHAITSLGRGVSTSAM